MKIFNLRSVIMCFLLLFCLTSIAEEKSEPINYCTPDDGKLVVKLKFDIDTKGHPFNIKVIDDGGLIEDDMAPVLKQFKSWRFEVRVEDGIKVVANDMFYTLCVE